MKKKTENYIFLIDSLTGDNQRLVSESTEMQKEYKNIVEEYSVTQKEKERLKSRLLNTSKLSVYKISGTGVYYKLNDEKETSSANKSAKLKICFKIMENAFVHKGTKNIYLRIAIPNGKIFTPGREYTFEYNGEVLNYSIRELIDYQQKEMDLCTFWKVKEPLKPGTYNISIYIDDSKVGEGSFILN